ncbi:ATP-grasp fold amidoligase family protein [Eudoraea chungangensis]|uniref:ATP-grasp fold amidoligase family protein n=1 Tax=Eudoraea chungangensis TaxID=1481905 RepID=UPI0023EB1CF7|nr:ATP-grasp fold amidoligase family protein [Eudoraea chungangensis]
MINSIKKFYLSNKTAQAIIRPILNFSSALIPQDLLLKLRFRILAGYALDLDNPRSFNEKIQWLKLNDRSELHIQCADKYEVRSHIAKKIGESYLIPLILSSDDVEDLRPDSLPNYPIIIKSNHSSGGVYIIRNKSEIDWVKVKEDFKAQLSQNYGDGKVEWQYEQIKPRFVIEKLLLDEHNKIPSDYKFHCFNGKVGMIQVDMERGVNHKRNLYDREWNYLDFTWNYYPNREPEIKPKNYDKMLEIAEILAKDFLYVRVDLYTVGENIYFGEMTFHPASGFARFVPQKWDYYFGDLLKLPTN